MQKLSLLLAASLLLFVCKSQSYGQCEQPGYLDTLQDHTGQLVVYDSTGLVDATRIAASWTFEQNYDSVKIRYRITEFRKNGGVLRLNNWCNGNEIEHLSDSILAENSRSETFVLAAGDTISFYREFLWFNPFNRGRLPDNYRAADSLTFSVELVSSESRTRLVLLDSLGVCARSTFGPPLLHGARPIMATARWVAPAELAGDSVFLRIAPRATGAGLFNFRQWGQLTFDLSGQLLDTFWTNYLEDYGGGLGKRAIQSVQSIRQGGSALHVHPLPTTGRVEISFSAPSDAHRQVIAVYDGRGSLEFLAFVSGAEVQSRKLGYTFPRPGVFYVVSIIDGIVAGVESVQAVK